MPPLTSHPDHSIKLRSLYYRRDQLSTAIDALEQVQRMRQRKTYRSTMSFLLQAAKELQERANVGAA